MTLACIAEKHEDTSSEHKPIILLKRAVVFISFHLGVSFPHNLLDITHYITFS